MTKRPGYPKLLSGIWRGLVGPVQVALLKGVLKASEKEEKERTKSKTCGTHPNIHSVESCRPQCPISDGNKTGGYVLPEIRWEITGIDS